MRNDQFLIASYFVTSLLCLGLAVAAYLWLRRPVEQIFSALPRQDWGKVLKKAFPASTILLALSGFLSVSYYGCTNRSYANIVSDHAYIISVNQQQIAATLSSIVVAVFVWAVIVVVNLWSIRREQAKRESPERN